MLSASIGYPVKYDILYTSTNVEAPKGIDRDCGLGWDKSKAGLDSFCAGALCLKDIEGHGHTKNPSELFRAEHIRSDCDVIAAYRPAYPQPTAHVVLNRHEIVAQAPQPTHELVLRVFLQHVIHALVVLDRNTQRAAKTC